MLKAINTKILLAILAALAAIGGLLLHEKHVSDQAAADAAKARMILEQQQRDADAAKQHDKELWEQVRRNRQKHNSAAGNESETWKKAIP